MKRLLIITYISLLFVSGWSEALAAFSCSHMAQDHSCCQMMNDASHGHDFASSAHEGMAMADGIKMTSPDAPVANEIINAIGRPSETCADCIGRADFPIAPVMTASAVEQSKRVAASSAPPAASSAPLLASTLTSPRQASSSVTDAPPGVSSDRHILISIFRI